MNKPSRRELLPVVRGRLEALVTCALYDGLVEMAVTEEHSGRQALGLWSDGTFFAMPEPGAG